MSVDDVQLSDAFHNIVTEPTQSISRIQQRRTVWGGVEHGRVLPSDHGSTTDFLVSADWVGFCSSIADVIQAVL